MTLTAIEQTLLILLLPQTGVAAYWRLLERFVTLNAVYSAPIAQLGDILHESALAEWQSIHSRGESHPLVSRVRQQIEWLNERNIHMIDTLHENYPALLREVKRAPPLLYVWGDPVVLNLPQIAIVGSRKPTAGGRHNANHFARGLAEAGFTITSGLALGVDVAAHLGALEVKGKTLAILGTGIDQIYPSRHVAIAEQIVAAGGAVATEFPLGTGALPSNFPQRNRIISGLSCGVLIVEAAIKSGSLITASYALQQNREVFAIPGSIQNPLSRGCHALIKDGAKLVEDPLDIIDDLKGMLAFKRHELVTLRAANLSEQSEAMGMESLVLECLGFDPVSFDDLAERAALPTGELMSNLLTLELKGLIINAGHGYSRIRS